MQMENTDSGQRQHWTHTHKHGVNLPTHFSSQIVSLNKTKQINTAPWKTKPNSRIETYVRLTALHKPKALRACCLHKYSKAVFSVVRQSYNGGLQNKRFSHMGPQCIFVSSAVLVPFCIVLAFEWESRILKIEG